MGNHFVFRGPENRMPGTTNEKLTLKKKLKNESVQSYYTG
jgi:hypothetical protein